MQSDKDTRKHRQAYRIIEGLFLSYCFDDDCVRSALAYEAHPEDVFVVTYPKCGTTWLQYILWAIFNDGVPPVNSQDFFSKMPFLEACGHIGRTPRPIAIKTHLPFQKQPYSKQAKYLYLSRNPYDCCVSYFYGIKVAPAYAFEEGTFEEFLDMFLEGKVEFGDYFENLLSWYEHRHDANVLFMTYEDLKKDTEGAVLKIADFLGKDHGERLRNDPDIVARILHACSSESMKKTLSDCLFMPPAEQSSESSPVKNRTSKEASEVSFRLLAKIPFMRNPVRKGVIGDWRNYFTEDQVRSMKNWITMRTADSDVMNLWANENLP